MSAAATTGARPRKGPPRPDPAVGDRHVDDAEATGAARRRRDSEAEAQRLAVAAARAAWLALPEGERQAIEAAVIEQLGDGARFPAVLHAGCLVMMEQRRRSTGRGSPSPECRPG